MNRFHFQPGPTHCVFRRGASWFALPAAAVREVLLRPDLFAVPGAAAILAGLCHVRSDFLPVLRLDPLLAEGPSCLPPEEQLLVINFGIGPWALLVDQVVALAPLEASAAPEGDFDGTWSAAVVGWAAYQTQIVRVLDAPSFYRLAEHVLRERSSNVDGRCGEDRDREALTAETVQHSHQPGEAVLNA